MRELLLAGIVGPLLFIAVFLVQGATRRGYNPWTMFVSQLATGPGGWVQILNFFMCGTLVIFFAVGLRGALAGTNGSVAGPVLIGLFGALLMISGTFPTDPQLGYPPGAPEVRSRRGTIHEIAGLGVFTSLPAACFVLAWHFSSVSLPWTLYSAAVGLGVIISFFVGGAMLARRPGAPIGLTQRIAIVLGWTWIAALAWSLSRQ